MDAVPESKRFSTSGHFIGREQQLCCTMLLFHRLAKAFGQQRNVLLFPLSAFVSLHFPYRAVSTAAAAPACLFHTEPTVFPTLKIKRPGLIVLLVYKEVGTKMHSSSR